MQKTSNSGLVYSKRSNAFVSEKEPGDFATKVKQINSQSDLIWMSSFAGPSYLTMSSSVYIILIWDFIFLIFTIYDELDALTYVGNLANVDFISMNK